MPFRPRCPCRRRVVSSVLAKAVPACRVSCLSCGCRAIDRLPHGRLAQAGGTRGGTANEAKGNTSAPLAGLWKVEHAPRQAAMERSPMDAGGRQRIAFRGILRSRHGLIFTSWQKAWLPMCRGLAFLFLLLLMPAGYASNVYRVGADKSVAVSDLAVLDEPKGTDVTISKVDGKRRPWGFYRQYELLPGRHVLGLQLIKFGSMANSDRLDIEFTAERGATYLLMAEVKEAGMSGTWTAWIVDRQSGLTVSMPVPQPGK